MLALVTATQVTGSFVYNADTGVFSGLNSGLNMTTSGGIPVPATSSWVFNTSSPGSEENTTRIAGFEAVDQLSGNEIGAHKIGLFTTSGPLLTNVGGTLTRNFVYAGTCADTSCAHINLGLPYPIVGGGEFTAADLRPNRTPPP